jgi:hypothetical protein
MIATLKAHPVRYAGLLVAGSLFGVLAFWHHDTPIETPRITPVPWQIDRAQDEDAVLIYRMTHPRSYAFTPTHWESVKK